MLRAENSGVDGERIINFEGGRTISVEGGWKTRTHTRSRKNISGEGEKSPDDWKRSLLIPILKQNGDVLDNKSNRRITLLQHILKILEKHIDMRLGEIVEVNQMLFRFRPGRGTTYVTSV